ncbi:MAG: OmpL47-type beta-barrel domain-containing protein, partial [Promethearchaeota archaeon]
VSLIGTDTNSGISLTLYRIDNNDWISYEAPFTLNDLYKEFLIEYYSTDAAGNTEPFKETTIMVEEVFHGEGKLKLEYKELWGDAIMTISKDLIRMEIGDEIIVWEIITSEEKDKSITYYGEGILGAITVKIDVETKDISASGKSVTFKSK